MWSRHSLRIDPISRSAKPFCQGEAGAIGLSRMPMARNRRVTTVPYVYFGCREELGELEQGRTRNNRQDDRADILAVVLVVDKRLCDCVDGTL
jgi:hypothetical protein